jgi:hypothetical protein
VRPADLKRKAYLTGNFAMPRTRCTFRVSDLRRAIKTTRAAGLEIGRVEIDRDGKIVVVPGKPPANDNDLDAELAAFEAKKNAR